MKKYIEKIFVIMMMTFIIPNFVWAETTDESAKAPVNVYVFRGEGCPHCEDALTFLNSIEKEYGKYFNLVSYECWYDANNNTLKEAVVKSLNSSSTGVPFIVVGEQYMSGYGDDSDGEALLKYIMDEYEKDADERVDVVEKVIKEINWQPTKVESNENKEKEEKKQSFIVGIVATVIIFGLIVFTREARKD